MLVGRRSSGSAPDLSRRLKKLSVFSAVISVRVTTSTTAWSGSWPEAPSAPPTVSHPKPGRVTMGELTLTGRPSGMRSTDDLDAIAATILAISQRRCWHTGFNFLARPLTRWLVAAYQQ